MKNITDLKIAFIGVAHWHVPLYLRAAEQENIRIVAMSDPDENKLTHLAAPFGCKCYTDAQTLLDEVNPDFVFAFAPHNEMPELAMNLVRRKIPFSMEKPMGLCAEDVQKVKEAAEEASVFCSIPFVWRYSDLINDFKKEVKAEDIVHLSFKFIAGPTSRYITTSPWMLEEKTAGGGCNTNLGVHFIDMAMYLTESTSAKVVASEYHYGDEYDIETYATTLVKLSSGATLSLETGYAFPMDELARDNRWNIVTKDGYYTLGDGCFEKRVYDKKTEKIEMSTDSDVYYPIYTLESLRQYVCGEKPRAGLEEMELVRVILDEMDVKAKQAEEI
ncbi:MAG: Gfo/Idh/MocA family oxidoreductase [Hespellia sp.]|nr:Gfo/Idh/MocA family oxidoreductase [Hespellia sp.]